MGIISTFFDAVTQPLQASITSTASAVIGAIAPTAQILLTVYICFWGWALIRGSVQVYETCHRICPSGEYDVLHGFSWQLALELR